MIKRLMMLYTHNIKNRFFIKLTIVYALMIAVPILIIANIASNNLYKSNLKKEVLNQKKMLEEITTVVQYKIDKINSDLLRIYDVYDTYDSGKTNIMNLLIDYNKGYLSKEVKIKNSIDKILYTDSNIINMIVLDAKGRYVCDQSNSVENPASPSYDYAKDVMIKIINENNINFKMFSFSRSKYLVKTDEPIITFAGTIVNTNINPSDNRIGNYILNFTPDLFGQEFLKIRGESHGDLLIIENEQVIYSSNQSEIGKPYEYASQLYNITGNEANLDTNYIISGKLIPDRNVSIYILTPKDILVQGALNVKRTINISLIIYLILILLLTSLVSILFSKRMMVLINSTKEIKKGNFSTRISCSSNDEIGQLSASINDMCIKIEDYINRVYVAEIKGKNAEIASLQSKINPHFLYNTLEAIRMKAVENDEEDISDMLYRIGELFRWNVKSKDLMVTVEDELEHIMLYLDLLQIRYNHSMTIRYEVDDKALSKGIPKLILQPLVENAIHHGLAPYNCEGTIIICIRVKQDILEIDVRDDGIGIDAYALKNLIATFDSHKESDVNQDAYSIGMKNVHQRIHLIFGSSYGLTVISKPQKGTTCTIKLPCLSLKEMRKYVQGFSC